MKKLLFDVNNQVDVPALILESKSGMRYGRIDGETGLKYKRNFNAANEISFTVPKYINGEIHHLWNSILDLKTIYVPDYDEKYQIKVKYNDEETETKSVVGTSLCEAELGQILLRNFECNTDNDLEVHNYQVTKFYDEENQDCSLLHRVLKEKASHYSVKYVADTLRNLSYEYTADEKSVYDFLTQDVAEQMQCLFLFDSMTRGIYVYDLCSTCNDCYEETIEKQYDENDNEIKKHYRDDFRDECPQCHSRNINSGYGKDTTILIDRENLATSIVRETDIDSLKNCLCVDGGDDLITDTFMMLNPNGSQYIYYFSDEVLAEMPQEFKNAYREYTKLYDYYYSSNVIDTNTTTHEYKNGMMTTNDFNANSKDSNYVDAYNAAVNHIVGLSDDEKYTKYKTYGSKYTFIGQPSLVTAYYNAIDVEGFLQSSMVPTYNMLVYDKYTALSMLTASAIGTIGIPGFGSTTVETVVKNAIVQSAKTIVNTSLFDVDVKTTVPYTHGDTTWTGVFVITDKQNDDDTTNTIDNQTYESIAIKEGHKVTQTISPTITLVINDDVATYCQNRIKYIVENSDLPVAIDLYELDKEVLSEDKFKEQIKLYSIDNLTILKNVMQSCMDVLSDKTMNINNSDTVNNKLLEYYNTYRNRQSKINDRIAVLTGKILDVQKFELLIHAYIKEIQKILNFQTFLQNYSDDQNLWDIFNYYRREDTYTNENIISEGIETNNANVVKHASYLMDFAKKAAIKAGTPQIAINTSLNNLLMIPEFSSIVNDFEVGNWIKVRTDINDNAIEDPIYSLRLLSYSINFDDIQNIEVEFSTATKTWSGIRDIKSVIESAQSMATSFTTISKQVEKSTDATTIVNTWTNNGLNLTNQAIVSQANDQSILIDEHGILARRYDEFSDTYDDCQLKIFNNGLYYSTDAWQSIKTGVGKFKYIDPKDWTEKIGYGVIADTIVSNIVLTKELGIYNMSGSMCFNDDGLVITNNKTGDARNKFIVNPNDSNQLLKITRGDNDTPVLYTDNAGNLNMIGTIDTTGGYIRGNLECLGKIKGGSIEGSYVNGGHMNIGNGTFTVDEYGNLTANNANIVGSINSGSTITGARINGGSITIGSNFSVDIYGNLIGVNSKFVNSLLVQDSTGTSREFYIDGEQAIINVPFYTYISFICGKGIAYDIGVTKGCEAFVVNTAGNTHIGIHNPEFSYGSNMYLYGGGKELQIARWVIVNSNNTTDEHFGVRPGSDEDVYLGSSNHKWSTIFSNKDTINTSDREKKREICPIDETLEKIYLETPTYTFYFNDGDRRHIGTISQEIEELIKKYELTSKEFAPFCKDLKIKEIYNEDGDVIRTEPDLDENGNYQYDYGFRYGEYTMFTVHMVQKLYNKVEKLQEQIIDLQNMNKEVIS